MRSERYISPNKESEWLLKCVTSVTVPERDVWIKIVHISVVVEVGHLRFHQSPKAIIDVHVALMNLKQCQQISATANSILS